MLERENGELEQAKDLKLIYPLLNYRQQFWLEDNYESEERLLKDEIESKKLEFIEGGDEKKKYAELEAKKICY
jgi:hypothetical protein